MKDTALALRRRIAGYTQEEIAERLGITTRRFRSLEANDAVATEHVYRQDARAIMRKASPNPEKTYLYLTNDTVHKESRLRWARIVLDMSLKVWAEHARTTIDEQPAPGWERSVCWWSQWERFQTAPGIEIPAAITAKIDDLIEEAAAHVSEMCGGLLDQDRGELARRAW